MHIRISPYLPLYSPSLPQPYIEDMSQNGTYIDGTLIGRGCTTELHDGALWGDSGRFGEIQGDSGRFGEIRGDHRRGFTQGVA